MDQERLEAAVAELRMQVARLRYIIRSTRTCKQDWLRGGHFGCV